MKNDKMIQVRF